jgi:hypothetical protein
VVLNDPQRDALVELLPQFVCHCSEISDVLNGVAVAPELDDASRDDSPY